MKKTIPRFAGDEAAERFVETADLTSRQGREDQHAHDAAAAGGDEGAGEGARGAVYAVYPGADRAGGGVRADAPISGWAMLITPPSLVGEACRCDGWKGGDG